MADNIPILRSDCPYMVRNVDVPSAKKLNIYKLDQTYGKPADDVKNSRFGPSRRGAANVLLLDPRITAVRVDPEASTVANLWHSALQ